MAYFNHAFSKTFLGTKTNLVNANSNQSAGAATTASGFIFRNTSPAVQYSTVNLIDGTVNGANLGIGSYGFFDPKTWTTRTTTSVPALVACCPLVLAASAIYQKDQIGGLFTGGGASGGFHGGYQESNKSKVINPKYISRMYKVKPCAPNQSVLHVGSTPFNTLSGGAGVVAVVAGGTYSTASTTLVSLSGGTGTGAVASITIAANAITVVTITTPGTGYSNGDILTPVIGTGVIPLAGTVSASLQIALVANTSDCCKEFLCDQAYTLRVDIKGSPALRALTRNSYFETSTWTGCCPANALAPVAVDPTTVYIYWATQLLNSPLVSPFIQIIVYDQNGVAIGVANDTNAWAAYTAQTVIPCNSPTPVPGAGMTIIGAYVGTVFGDCTFYPTDFFEKEPVRVFASMVDLTGSVCDFAGVCITESCCPRQGNGFGDTVLKDLILSERYQQNDFYTGRDLRIREITQGYDVSTAVNRSAFFTRYVIQHNVPRFNNPTGVFDNDQYQLEIITNGTDTNLETFLSTWTAGCGPCEGLETFSCGSCCPKPSVAPQATVGALINTYSYQLVASGGTGAITYNASVADDAALATLNMTVSSAGLIKNTIGAVLGPLTVNITVTGTDIYGTVVFCENIQVASV